MFPLRDSVRSQSPPLVTSLLIVVNALVFFSELGMSEQQLWGFFHTYGLVPVHVLGDGSRGGGAPLSTLLPFLTGIFLHSGWLHFLSNMWILWIFGDNVEDRLGKLRYLLFYIVSGVAASLLHVVTNPSSALPVVGASGAIAGVMGAYFVLYPKARVVSFVLLIFWPVFFEIPAVVFLGFWFLTQIFSGVLSLGSANMAGGVAWWAHVGGFVAGGLLLAPFLARVPRRAGIQSRF
jgi:membrane associated rhomboid family serine protease